MAWQEWAGVALVVAGFFLGAKAHGRALRLERECAGFWAVTFGVANPPFVDALWRAERRRYWAVSAGAAMAGLAVLVSAAAWGTWLPFAGLPAGLLVPSVVLLVVAPMAVAFVVTGLSAEARRMGRIRSGGSWAVGSADPVLWRRRAALAGAFWWAFTAGALSAAWLLA